MCSTFPEESPTIGNRLTRIYYVMAPKHSRSDDEELRIGGKRIKLDSLFDTLNLSDTPSRSATYVIPEVISCSDNKSGSRVPPDFNTFIAERLMSHYNNTVMDQHAVIPWYNPRVLVVYRFQRWVVRMFNKFIARYNQQHRVRVPLVHSYDKAVRLAQQNGMSVSQLFELVLEVNRREMIRLQNKYDLKEVEEYKDVSYTYWDTFRGVGEDEMEVDRELVEEGDMRPIEMDGIEGSVDEGKYYDVEGSIESNYGSYYYDYASTNSNT